jgi:hypothetical protein
VVRHERAVVAWLEIYCLIPRVIIHLANMVRYYIAMTSVIQSGSQAARPDSPTELVGIC